jgi:hypothetical protein
MVAPPGKPENGVHASCLSGLPSEFSLRCGSVIFMKSEVGFTLMPRTDVRDQGPIPSTMASRFGCLIRTHRLPSFSGRDRLGIAGHVAPLARTSWRYRRHVSMADFRLGRGGQRRFFHHPPSMKWFLRDVDGDGVAFFYEGDGAALGHASGETWPMAAPRVPRKSGRR